MYFRLDIICIKTHAFSCKDMRMISNFKYKCPLLSTLVNGNLVATISVTYEGELLYLQILS